MIKAIQKEDIFGLNFLAPIDWDFDYESFLRDFIDDDFFYAFVLIHNDKIVGTGNVFLKDKIGWLANIMVDKGTRGKGHGQKITKFLVDFLKEKNCKTQFLLATELGEHVYKKIGFKTITKYVSFDSIQDELFNAPKSIRPLKRSNFESVCKLDQEANNENRRHLIDKFYQNGMGYFDINNELIGFYLPCFGRGLVLARNPQAGIELLNVKHVKKGTRTMLPMENIDGINYLVERGLKKGVPCKRMFLGEEKKWTPIFIYSYGGGFCG